MLGIRHCRHAPRHERSAGLTRFSRQYRESIPVRVRGSEVVIRYPGTDEIDRRFDREVKITRAWIVNSRLRRDISFRPLHRGFATESKLTPDASNRLGNTLALTMDVLLLEMLHPVTGRPQEFLPLVIRQGMEAEAFLFFLFLSRLF